MSVLIQKQSDGFDLITLTSSKGSSLTLSQFGAGMYSFLIGGAQMLSSSASYSDYANSKSYYGKFIGPIAGRVGEGRIYVGDKRWFLPINESHNSLHSASLCYAFFPFEYEISENEEALSVTFERHFPASIGQYNASVDARIVYTLSQKEDKISIAMSCLPDTDAPLNITNHAYFCLGQDNVYSCLLKIRQKGVASYSSGMLLKEFIRPSKALDFSKGKTVGLDINSPDLRDVGGLDHAFLVEGGPLPQAELIGKDFSLEVSTDAPALQIYATNYPIMGQKMIQGCLDSKGSGITFEAVSRMDESLICPKGIKQTRNVTFSFKRRGEGS